MLALHRAQLNLILNVAHLLGSRNNHLFLLFVYYMVLVARMTLDFLVVCQLFCGRRVSFALTLDAPVIGTRVSPSEGLVFCGNLGFLPKYLRRRLCCGIVEVILVEKLALRSHLIVLFLITFP